MTQNPDTFIPNDPSLTGTPSLFAILLSVLVPYMTSHTTSSSLIPIVSRASSLTQNTTATQPSVSSLDTQGTSKNPVTDFSMPSVDSL